MTRGDPIMCSCIHTTPPCLVCRAAPFVRHLECVSVDEDKGACVMAFGDWLEEQGVPDFIASSIISAFASASRLRVDRWADRRTREGKQFGFWINRLWDRLAYEQSAG